MNTPIIEEWKREGIELNKPADYSDIAGCEIALNFTFPEDFKKFYQICNGFAKWQMDSRMLSLWPLEKIKAGNSDTNYIAFADYNINGSQIGFIKGRQGIYKDYDLSKICDTFEEFIEHWYRDTGVYF